MATVLVPDPGNVDRAVPARIQKKYDDWKLWARVWNTVHYISGAGAAALSAIIAANSKANPAFLTANGVLVVASSAAIFSFILTTLNPQKSAQGFIAAYRHLEKAMSRYCSNQVDAGELGKAEQEGIDKLA